ncbi:MAG: ANTAR domain-containing response regulator [Senegalia sp. (in: firmicutes)]|uniref:ANTAR domain-containing response regulator n=1 Tax=Senegalia sp. (in: firmicutes) TaxID=1924098 RepID=UPI003F95CF59
MSKGRILICDSSEYIRTNIKKLLLKRSFQVYEATNGLEALRLARSIYPELVILDLNLWGMNSIEVGKIIEKDNISTVIYMTSKVDAVFLNEIEKMKLYAYIKKPIIGENLYQIIDFALINSNKINNLKRKVNDLEIEINSRKNIDKAKRMLMKKLNITEEESYSIIRRESMNRCISIEKVAQEIIEKNSKSI